VTLAAAVAPISLEVHLLGIAVGMRSMRAAT
jgi:hypothetical protein